MTIVCGVDFSPSSLDTVEAASAFASVLAEPLVLAHALGDVTYLVDAGARRDLHEAASMKLTRLAAELAPPAAPERIRAEVLDGGAHRGLIGFAQDQRASLLVVGSHGHSGHARLGMGSTAERCALHALCPVLVARESAPFMQWAAGHRRLQVVVCVDPFGAPGVGLAFLRRLRAAAPCDVTAAYAYHPDEVLARQAEPPPASLVEPDAQLEHQLIEDLAEAIGDVPGMGRFTIAVKLAVTRFADPLVALATHAGADLMVVGTHHHRGPPRPWSVSAGVVHLSPISVATVPTSRTG